ncbi:hypothetical protein [Streptomyces sp. HG99]|nr:hypothetical protein [Streptomyces sp. HG99]
MNAEQPDQMDRINAVAGFVQDAVGPQLPGSDAGLVEGRAQ